MKRMLCLILAVLCVTAVFSGCQKEPPDTQITTPSTSSAPQENGRKVTFRGQTYSVTYLDRVVSEYGSAETDRYCNDEVTIYLDCEDESFEGIHYQGLIDQAYCAKPDIVEPFQSACALAEQIASQYIQVEDYTRIEESYEITSEDEVSVVRLYTFRYVKYVGDYPTEDDLYVQITSKGDLRTLHIGERGRFDNVSPTAVDAEAVRTSLEARLDELYRDIGSYTYTIVKQTLAYSPEEELTLVSQIELHVDLEGGDGYDTAVILATVC